MMGILCRHWKRFRQRTENKIHSARGSLEEYANPKLLKEEDSAWEKAAKLAKMNEN